MIKHINYFLFALAYLFKTKILRKEIPFIGGLVINEKCNLNCRHCDVKNRNNVPDLSYSEVKAGLEIFHNMGIRNVFIEGGEPFLWKDGDKRINDIVRLARGIGFHLVSIYTNGTIPIEVTTDSVFVSIDGLKETNNYLRGNGRNIFDLVMKNIITSRHRNIFINFTINQQNKSEIGDFCHEIADIKQIRGLFFYFHTPYYGIDDLFIPLDEKRRIIKKIISLKKDGLKILNSYACLNGVFHDNWKRPSKLCYVYANNQLYQCCRAIGNDLACNNCGYLGYPEIIHILQLRPTSIWSALSYLPRR